MELIETDSEIYDCKDISISNQINLLKCKLETKSQVLKSLSKELILCKKDKDDLKSKIEQLEKKLNFNTNQVCDNFDFGSINDYNKLVLNQNYKKLEDINNNLNFELKNVKIKLHDAESDLRLLRDELIKIKKRNETNLHIEKFKQNLNYKNDSLSLDKNEQFKNFDYLIEELEKLKKRNKLLEKDVKLLLDEKEELTKSRNNYMMKTERLNQKLNELMNGDLNITEDKEYDKNQFNIYKNKETDIVSVLLENNFLREKIENLEQENQLNQNTLDKYKNIFENTNNKKDLPNFTSNLSKKSKTFKLKDKNYNKYFNQEIIYTKEVQSFIASNDLNYLELNENTLIDIRKLVLALFETVADKSTALTLAKNNNKLLGKRITDLENKIKFYQEKEKL